MKLASTVFMALAIATGCCEEDKRQLSQASKSARPISPIIEAHRPAGLSASGDYFEGGKNLPGIGSVQKFNFSRRNRFLSETEPRQLSKTLKTYGMQPGTMPHMSTWSEASVPPMMTGSLPVGTMPNHATWSAAAPKLAGSAPPMLTGNLPVGTMPHHSTWSAPRKLNGYVIDEPADYEGEYCPYRLGNECVTEEEYIEEVIKEGILDGGIWWPHTPSWRRLKSTETTDTTEKAEAAGEKAATAEEGDSAEKRQLISPEAQAAIEVNAQKIAPFMHHDFKPVAPIPVTAMPLVKKGSPSTAYGHSPSTAYGHSPSTAYGHSPSTAYFHSPSTAYGHSPSTAHAPSPSTAVGAYPSHGTPRHLQGYVVEEGGDFEGPPPPCWYWIGGECVSEEEYIAAVIEQGILDGVIWWPYNPSWRRLSETKTENIEKVTEAAPLAEDTNPAVKVGDEEVRVSVEQAKMEEPKVEEVKVSVGEAKKEEPEVSSPETPKPSGWRRFLGKNT